MPFCELRYRSESLQKQVMANVLLPSPDLEPPYYVMFLLHGLSDDHSAWVRNTSIERYMWGLPMIVVMPDGGRGFYSDAEQGFAYYTDVAIELPKLIQQYFPTKEAWCATGLSMGGYGAFKLALSRPELFVSGHSHSGAVGFGHRAEYFDDDRSPEFRRILGSEPVGGPNDLYALAAKLAPENRPKLRFDCGVDDFLIEDNRAFHANLLKIGYVHEYEEFAGDHNWGYWDEHVQDAISFHCRNLGIKRKSANEGE